MAIIGDLSAVRPDSLWGFAFDDTRVEPIEVSLFVDGNRIAMMKADQFRKEVKALGLHPTGNCGFSFGLVENGIFLPESATIEVKAGPLQQRINQSPFIYEAQGGAADADHCLIAGLAKSGTTILTHRIASCRPQAHICFEPRGPHALTDVAIHRWYAGHYPQLVTKCIFHPDVPLNLESIEAFYTKKIWIIRDPRDRILSAFFWGWKKKYFNHPELDLDAKWKLLKEKEATPDKVPFHTLLGPKEISYFVYLEKQMYSISQKLAEGWFKLRYEDLVRDETEELEAYLGHSLDHKILETQRLKLVGRTKSFDNWRRWFTEEDVAFLRPLLTPFLIAGGYDPQDWRLLPQAELSAAEGSEYVKKSLLQVFEQRQLKPPSYLS